MLATRITREPNISIDESEQVIKIQRQYLLKSDENLLIPFNEIGHVIYRFEEGYGGCPSQVTVEGHYLKI